MKGKPHPVSVRIKLSLVKKGKPKPPFSDEHIAHMKEARHRRKIQPATGMHHSEEARRKMSEARKGAKNGRWIDGRKQTPYPPEWTKSLRAGIREGQDYRCLLCGEPAEHMNVHHIDWNKQNCAPENLAGLCTDCHGLVHRRSNIGLYELVLRHKRRGISIEAYPPTVILKPAMIEMGEGCRLDGMTKVEGGQGVTIGRWVHIASFAHVNIGGGRVIIGEGVAIASGARILAGSNMKQGHFMSCAAPKEQQVIVRSYVEIEAQAFIGAGATVMMGVHVGQGAIVGAGAVVTHDVPAWEIWAGVPARKIGDRARV